MQRQSRPTLCTEVARWADRAVRGFGDQPDGPRGWRALLARCGDAVHVRLERLHRLDSDHRDFRLNGSLLRVSRDAVLAFEEGISALVPERCPSPEAHRK